MDSAAIPQTRRGELVAIAGKHGLDSRKAQQIVQQAIDEWTDLHADSAAADPFPVNELPTAMSELVLDISRVHRTPPALAACYALGAISASIGKGLWLPTAPGKTTSGNLYILVGADSAAGKTSAFKPIMAPIREYEGQKNDDFSKTHPPQHRAKTAKRKNVKPSTSAPMESDAGCNKDGESRLMLTCENITSEAMVEQLAENGACTALMSGDGRDVIGVIRGRYRKGGQTDESLLLKGFSEEPFQVGRKASGHTYLKAPRIVCCIAVQPDKLTELFGEKFARKSGLLPRFLTCKVDLMLQPIDRSVQEPNEEALKRWSELLTGVLVQYHSGGTREVQVSAGAETVLDQYANSIIARLRTDLHDVGEFGARWAEQAWRVAPVLHAGKHGNKAHKHPLSAATARAAVKIVEWFARQQLQLLEANKDAAQVSQEERVLQLIRKVGEVKPSDVLRKRITKTAQEAKDLLDQMHRKGTLQYEERIPDGGGTPSHVYWLAD